MSTLRSPTGSGLVGGRSESYPNIAVSTQLLENKDNIQGTSRNRRKGREDNDPIKSELSEMRKQMGEIMSYLKRINESHTEKIDKISEDISIIRNQINSVSNITDSLTTEHEKLKREIDDVIKTNTSISNKIESLETKFNTNGKEGVTYEEFIKEIQERDTRSKNLIFIGVSEPNQADVSEQKKMDMKSVTLLLKSVHDEYPAPVKTIRLGKPSTGKNRPLKAIFQNKETVSSILKNSKNITTDKIKIYSDKTPYQQGF